MSPFTFLGDGQENKASSAERTLEYVSTARPKFDEPSAKKEKGCHFMRKVSASNPNATAWKSTRQRMMAFLCLL